MKICFVETLEIHNNVIREIPPCIAESEKHFGDFFHKNTFFFHVE